MTADRDCELTDSADAGKVVFHTCQGGRGYSGRRSWSARGNGIEIAGIHVATMRDGITADGCGAGSDDCERD